MKILASTLGVRGRFVATLCRLAVVACAIVVSDTCAAQDTDGDGLQDSFEQQLLNTYRPWLYYDHDEPVWPCSATWFVQHSRLIDTASSACQEIPQSQLQANPRLVLNAGTWTTTARGSGLKIDIVDGARTGQFADNPELSANVPIYGHVVALSDSPGSSVSYRITNNNVQTFGSGYTLVQYWMLFPYNDYHGFDRLEHCWCVFGCCLNDIGDHEGDWVWIDILINNATNTPEFVAYHHHGDRNIWPSVRPWNTVEIGPDGGPVIYLEKGVHECWPTAGEGHGISSPLFDLVFQGLGDIVSVLDTLRALIAQDPELAIEPHQGNGVRYRPSTVINLGEAGRPMQQATQEAQTDCDLVLLFNGEWGDFTGPSPVDEGTTNPPGPVNQGVVDLGCVSNWPFPFPANGPSGGVIWVDFGASYDECTRRPSGSSVFPYPTLAGGAGAVGRGGTVAMRAGSSHESLPVRIERPMTLTVEGGPATIGH